MILPSNRVRIVVATKPVDFRKGHDGLAALAQTSFFIFGPLNKFRCSRTMVQQLEIKQSGSALNVLEATSVTE